MRRRVSAWMHPAKLELTLGRNLRRRAGLQNQRRQQIDRLVNRAEISLTERGSARGVELVELGAPVSQELNDLNDLILRPLCTAADRRVNRRLARLIDDEHIRIDLVGVLNRR